MRELRKLAPPGILPQGKAVAVRLTLLALLVGSRQEISPKLLAWLSGVDPREAGAVLDELVLCGWMVCKRRPGTRGKASWWYRLRPKGVRVPPLPPVRESAGNTKLPHGLSREVQSALEGGDVPPVDTAKICRDRIAILLQRIYREYRDHGGGSEPGGEVVDDEFSGGEGWPGDDD